MGVMASQFTNRLFGHRSKKTPKFRVNSPRKCFHLKTSSCFVVAFETYGLYNLWLSTTTVSETDPSCQNLSMMATPKATSGTHINIKRIFYMYAYPPRDFVIACSTGGVSLQLLSSPNEFSLLKSRHNERNDVSNHRRLDCLLNRLFGRR